MIQTTKNREDQKREIPQIALATAKAFDGLKNGHPSLFLLQKASVALFEEPTLFLADRYVNNGSTPSPHTWAAAAYALKSWFEFLYAIDRDWRRACRQDRIDYRDAYCTAISPRTHHVYDAATPGNHMRVIKSFHVYAQSKGWYEGDLAFHGDPEGNNKRTSLDRDSLAHIRRGGKSRALDRDLPKIVQKHNIRPLSPPNLRVLLDHLGPRASETSDQRRSSRDRLFADVGWTVGLRLTELTQLATIQFLSLHPSGNEPLGNQKLVVRGKGAKTRSVAIPNWVVLDALAYIEGERREALKSGRVSSKGSSNLLFLAGTRSNRPGRPIQNRRCQQIVEEACLATGLARPEERHNLSSGETYTQWVPSHHVHDLRHTYAVLTYYVERMLGNSEPWKKIQAQLGHAHLSTTMDTYLAHVEIFGENERLIDVRKMLDI